MIIIKADIEKLVNDSYKVLALLYYNQITIREETYCPLSQKEICESIGITRSTLNLLMKRLKTYGFITYSGVKKYCLSDRAIQIVEKIEKI